MSNNTKLRAIVRAYYDCQRLRIQTGNRLVTNVLVSMGQAPGNKLDESLSEEAQDLLAKLVAEYKRLADALSRTTVRGTIRQLRTESGVITNIFEYELTRFYSTLLDTETELVKTISMELENYPIWTKFLKQVKGCGPLMAAVLISELDPRKAKYVSSFHKYCGLDVAPDGRGRSKRSEHLVTVEYKAKDGTVKEKQSITYNPFIKTKILGVLAVSFLRSGSPYAETYYNYKHRLENHVKYCSVKPVVRHRMALRYMAKAFLRDLYVEWRTIEGLEVFPPYAEAKLGITHGKTVA